MRSFSLVTTLFAALALAGCRRAEPVGLADTPERLVFREELATVPADPASIMEATVTGDHLVLRVQHGGGCAEHRFALFAVPGFLESDPVQVRAQLAHDARGDVCRALVGATLRFDLAPLEEAYRAAYGRGGTVVLQLREPGPSPRVVSVRYSF